MRCPRRTSTGVSGVAVAAVVVDVVEAGSAVAARRGGALVDVHGAVLAREARAGAVARVAVEGVHAAPAVLARLRLHPRNGSISAIRMKQRIGTLDVVDVSRTSQSSMSISHLAPVRPSWQTQEKLAMPSTHVEPAAHGFVSHSLILIEQSFPAR